MFQGSIAALITPLTDSDEIDFRALDRLVDFHRGNGTKGLVIAGTTGESASLSRDEFVALLKHVRQRSGNELQVIAGTGAASTRATILQTRLAADSGADAALVVTPYYYRPPQRGLEAHYRAVADAVELPLLLYNVPGRTAVDLLPETVARLADHERIIGIKEALPDMQRIKDLVKLCGDEFVILSGDDPSCLQAQHHGASGVISVAANVAPAQMAELCSAVKQGDSSRAEAINDTLQDLFAILMIETNPIPVKWAVFELGLAGSEIRLPLTRLDESLRNRLREVLEPLQTQQHKKLDT